MPRPTPTSEELGVLLETCRTLFQRVLRSRSAAPGQRAEMRLPEAIHHAEQAIEALDTGERDGSVAGPAGAAEVAERLLAREARLEEVATGLSARAAGSSAGDPREGLRGDASCIALPDLIGFLQVHSKTGTLRIHGSNEVFSLGFQEGDVIYAYSDNTPPGARLAEILVRQNAIDPGRLGAFLVDHSSDQGRLGEALARESLVTREQIRSALEEQVQLLFSRLFDGEGTTFVFLEGDPEPSDETLRLSVLQLLLESARKQDEASRS